MKYTEAKEKIEALLAESKAKLEALGVTAIDEVEVAENDLGDGESEIMKVFGSIAVKTPELTEDEVFYLSVDLDVYEDEIEDSDVAGATDEFGAALGELIARLEAEEDKSAAIRKLGQEIDEAIEADAKAELARTDKATKRDLMIATIALGIIAVIAFAFMVISELAAG